MKMYTRSHSIWLVGLSVFILSGCAGMRLPPISIDSSYRQIGNSEECSCSFKSAEDGGLYRFTAIGRKIKAEILNPDATETREVLMSDDPQYSRYFPIYPQHYSGPGSQAIGTLNEDDGTLDVHFIGGDRYVLDLRLDKFPHLFKTGFVISLGLQMMSAIQNEKYIFAALRKPGNIVVLRFDKMSSAADKVIYQRNIPHKKAIGQIFSFIKMLSPGATTTDYSHYLSFAKDYGNGDFYIGYTTQITKTKSADKPTKIFGASVVTSTSTDKPDLASLTVYNENGEFVADLTHEQPEDYYYLLTSVHRNTLIGLGSRGSGLAFNKNTMLPQNVQNHKYIVATSAKGAVYYDAASGDYYFRAFDATAPSN